MGELDPSEDPVKLILSDGIFANPMCLYVGDEPQPHLTEYCSIKVLKYIIDDSVGFKVMMISKLEVVNTAEVRECLSRYFVAKTILNSAKRKPTNWKSREMENLLQCYPTCRWTRNR